MLSLSNGTNFLLMVFVCLILSQQTALSKHVNHKKDNVDFLMNINGDNNVMEGNYVHVAVNNGAECSTCNNDLAELLKGKITLNANVKLIPN